MILAELAELAELVELAELAELADAGYLQKDWAEKNLKSGQDSASK